MSDGEATTEELRAQADSIIENISVLRSSMERMDRLEGYRRLLRDLLKDCRRVVARSGNDKLVARITAVLKETSET